MREDERRDEEGKSEEMGMQIGVEEREKRKLVDRLPVADDSRGVPVIELAGEWRVPRVQRAGEVSREDRAASGGEADRELAAR